MFQPHSAMALPECDPARRRLLQSVSDGVLGFGLTNWLALEAAAKTNRSTGEAKQILVVYEEGGISQMDSWDRNRTHQWLTVRPSGRFRLTSPAFSFRRSCR